MAARIFSEVVKSFSRNLCPNVPLVVQSRNTYILKRRYAPNISRPGRILKKLRGRNFIYDFVEYFQHDKTMPVVLTTNVEGVGQVGECVDVKTNFARKQLLLPKRAVYATPENIEKYKKIVEARRGEILQSTKFAPLTAKWLSKHVVFVTMNASNSWILEKWHVVMALRKIGFVVPEYALELPSEVISGPDSNHNFKDFAVFVTINNLEKATVRCRLYLWSHNEFQNEELTDEMKESVAEPIFEEQREILNSLPPPIIPKPFWRKAIKKTKNLK